MQSQGLFFERVAQKYFINLIYLSKILAMLYHKQAYKGGNF